MSALSTTKERSPGLALLSEDQTSQRTIHGERVRQRVQPPVPAEQAFRRCWGRVFLTDPPAALGGSRWPASRPVALLHQRNE